MAAKELLGGCRRALQPRAESDVKEHWHCTHGTWATFELLDAGCDRQLYAHNCTSSACTQRMNQVARRTMHPVLISCRLVGGKCGSALCVLREHVAHTTTTRCSMLSTAAAASPCAL